MGSLRPSLLVTLAGLLLLSGGTAAAGTSRQRSTTARVQKLTRPQVKTLRTTWDAARNTEDFLTATGFKPHDLAALRSEHGGFEGKKQGRRLRFTEADVPVMKRNWKRVESGEWTMQQFLDAHDLPGRNYMQTLRIKYPGDFEPVRGVKRRIDRSLVRSGADWKKKKVVPAASVEKAAQLFARYHRDELRYGELMAQLREIGVTDTDVRRLKASDPVRFRSQDAFRVEQHAAIVGAVLALGRRYRPSIRSIGDLFEVVNRSPEFVARFGKIPTSAQQNNWLLQRDREQGDVLRRGLADELGLTNRPERERVALPRGSVGSLDRSALWRSGAAPDLRVMAKELAKRLDREEAPSRERLKAVLAELSRENPAYGSQKRIDKLIATYQGLYPTLERWNLRPMRPYSTRYVARWMDSMHRAGPRASFEEIAAIFRESPEFAEDGRLPRDLSWTAEIARNAPRGVMTGWRARRAFQTSRLLVEAIRTAPAGTSLYALTRDTGLADLRTARGILDGLDAGRMRELGLDPALLARMRRSDWTGLGEAADPTFDPKVEPPDVDMTLVRDILDVPRIPPLMRRFLDRLDGKRPFRHHHTLIVNHRYSDIVPFVETLIAAGMTPENARFVTTPYPFNDATRVMVEALKVKVLDREQTVAGVKDGIERGIRELLAKGGPDRILIFDDGGLASQVIQEKFSQHMDRFKIVEITTAGHRLGMQFQEDFRRMPLVYGSAARNDVKVRITSAAHARRVVGKVIDLVKQSGLALPTRKVVVIGGGAMGLPAARELAVRAKGLRAQGIELVIVENDPVVARKLSRTFKVQPMEQALRGAGLVLGMTGKQVIGLEETRLLPDGAILVQGSSKRNEFDMDALERAASDKTLIPRTDGLGQRSYTYRFGAGKRARSIHVLGDGWTINHDGSLHGTPIEMQQLELAVLLETASLVAKTHSQRTGQVIELGSDVQADYVAAWKVLPRSQRVGPRRAPPAVGAP